MANPTQKRERRTREELLPAMRRASKWLLDPAHPDRKMRQALADFDVPYSSFWLFHWRQANPDKIVSQAEIDKHGGIESAWLKQQIAKMRDNTSKSWGEIAAHFGDGDFGISESKIRSLYRVATNRSDEGLRIGRGGRFLGGQEFAPVLYRPHEDGDVDRKKLGSELAVGEKPWEAAERLANHKPAKAPAKRKPSARKKADAA